MSLRDFLFAYSYDMLNSSVETRLVQYREETAGKARGEVLEIGGGTGANLPFYRSDANLTIVEPNTHMAKLLRVKANELGRVVKIVDGYGEDLAFADGSFDAVVSTLVLCMVDDLPKVITEVRRVLKPGGAFYFYEHVVSRRPIVHKFQDILNPFWRLLTTGCNLNRDIEMAIKDDKFTQVEVTNFSLSVGMPVTLPNIVGVAKV